MRARVCWHVWRERKTRRLYDETGFILYPKQCVTCFLADA